MSDFSRSPLELLLASRRKGYVGLHIEQGVPLLDRDLNLLQDLLAAGVRSLFTRYVGDGVAAGGDGFRIVARPAGQDAQDLLISAGGTGGSGSCLVGGIEVSIGTDLAYSAQPGVPPLTTPTPAQPNPRIDTVYLEVFLVEVDGSVDPELANGEDVGMQTSVRLRPAWVVRVAEGGPVPAPDDGHAVYPLARLTRPQGSAAIRPEMIEDLRQRRLTVADLEQRLSLVERVLLLPAFAAPPQPEFLPRSGVIGQPVTVNGTNLDVGRPVVLFGEVPGTIVGTPTPRQLVVTVPGGVTTTADPVSVRLTVSNAGGAAVSSGLFTVLAAPAFGPSGRQFSPVHGTPGTQVTVSGFNLDIGTPTVLFGTVNANVLGTPAPTSVVVEVPNGLVPAGRTSADVRLTVTTTVGTDVSDDVFRAELALPAPEFAAQPFLPRSGVIGQTVTLRGANFDVPPVSVSFGATLATMVGAPSATQIVCQVPTVQVPSGGLAVRITVTTGGGSATTTDTFQING